MNDMENKLAIGGPLADMMHACEHFCVVYCCGIYAFDPSAESVGYWMADVGREKAQAAQTQLHALIEQAKASDSETNLEVVLKYEWMDPVCGGHWASEKWVEVVTWLTEWDAALTAVLKQTK